MAKIKVVTKRHKLMKEVKHIDYRCDFLNHSSNDMPEATHFVMESPDDFISWCLCSTHYKALKEAWK